MISFQYICQMLSFLNKPYPLYEMGWKRILVILSSGLFVSLFLIIFQPFGTDTFDHPYKNAILMGYSLAIIFSFLGFEFISRAIFPSYFKDEAWTVGKQIMYSIPNVALSIAACYFYKQWIFGLHVSWQGLLGFYQFALPIASFVVVGWIILDYITKLKKYEQSANAIQVQDWQEEKTIPTSDNTTHTVLLQSQNGKEQFEVLAKELFYIQSADNYCRIFYWKGEKLESNLLRNTLNQLSQQIEDEWILRCHRSYIINLKKVKDITGNAQGYTLHLDGIDAKIPVARSKSKAVLNLLEA